MYYTYMYEAKKQSI